jgi:hypothetical protein
VRLSTSEIWEPDILVQQQFFAAHKRRVAVQPEKALLFAVLSEAIETFKRYAFTSSAHGRALFSEADKWFHEEDNSEFVFSFGNICAVLALSPGYIRRGLSQWLVAKPAPREGVAEKTPRRAYHKKSLTPRRYTTMQRRSPRLKGGWI